MKTFSIILSLVVALILAGAGCSTPPQVVRTDPEIERDFAVARSAYAAGSMEKAAIYYQKALQRSRVTDSPREIARNAYNLAACLAALCSYDAAQACLDEARLEFQRAGIPCRELPLLEAKIARAQGHLQEALSLASVEQKKTDGQSDAISIQWRILLAELLCDQDQVANADAELDAIDPRQLKTCGNDIRAETALIRARVQMLKRNPQAAALQYDIAAGSWQAAGRYSALAIALDQAGHAYENAGNSSLAADRYYRAARSLFEDGQPARARDLVTRALPLAAASLQPELQRQLERVKAEIDRQQQRASTADKKTN